MFGGHECLLELVDEKNCANMVGCRHCENCIHYVISSYTILGGNDE